MTLLGFKTIFRLAAASDKVYQLLAHGQWFSPGSPASSTTKTGHHETDFLKLVFILLDIGVQHLGIFCCTL
jgi:hypothetical protein